ncbi:universal stress protein [Heyndrickxia acidiproducens]|uniref:universal stress protein n=1 Tax=Heyndrickxia acidiproducens TaxID=1121084 RepID=UPI0003623030|nr:universal stress protein [Heyndrickxia acidiproducens]
MFNRILVAIDGSEMSDKALKTALNFAKERFSKVGVIHVERNLNIAEGMSEATVEDIYAEQAKEDNDLLKQAVSLAEEEEIEIEPLIAMGDPAIQIVKKAEEGNYQLIVMGSRGLGNIKGLMLGSVSQKVSQLAHCPVLIIK